MTERDRLSDEDQSELHILATEAFQGGCPRVAIDPADVIQLIDFARELEAENARLRSTLEKLTMGFDNTSDCSFCGAELWDGEQHAGACVYVRACDAPGKDGGT